MRHTRTFYKITIHKNATNYVNDDPNQGEDPTTTHCCDVSSHECDTLKEVREYLKEQYGDTVPTFAYVDDAQGEQHPVSLIYEYEEADYSHSPVDRWDEMDDVDVFKVTAVTINPAKLGIKVEA